ncbi:VCBS domain-containing protein [Vibrio sp. 16]|uniref:VCBS domain-containing protein n=1 Tax=Vibrio sp. 16 TaxID=391586 RepID=UPI002FEF364D
MNTNSSSLLATANSVVVIDANGQVRELLPGESPQPGEVVVSVEQGDSAPPQIDAQLVNDNGVLSELNLDNEIAAIFDQIEQGVDPTLNEEFATAAGGQNGSSLTGSGDIERIGTETIASTSFDTTGLESQGLSETQSLSLLDVVQDSLTPQAIILGDDSVRADETDEPLVLTGSLVATESEDTSFIPQTDVQGEYGLFSIDAEGNWTFTADHAFDELNVGDSIAEVFEVQSGDGTIASVSVAIDGTNDLPEFVATAQEAPADDVNLAPFNVSSYSFDYSEEASAGETIGQVAATDPDNSVLIFSISTNLQDGEGNDLYQINPATGEISLTEAGSAAFVNDFEQLSNSHNIVVTVTEGDGVGEPQSVDVDVFLNEQNLDDNPPTFEDVDDGGYSFNYNENLTDTDVIGVVSASDPDGENVTYSITTNVTSDADEPLFEIDVNSGEISLTAAGVAAFTNDFELASNVHNIVVTATEDEGLGEVKSTNINVELSELNLDEDSPIFVDDDDTPVEDYAFEYNENSLDSDVIGTVAAVDGDGENVTYSITTNVTNDADEPLFEIDANSGEVSLTAAGVAAFTNDFELASNVHNIVVTATEDEGLGDVKSTNINVELSELNLDEDSPIFVDDDDNPVEDYAFEYNENSLDSDVIGTVAAVDGDGENVTYSITTNVSNDADEPLFEIDTNSGEISLTAAGVAAFTNDFELASNVHNIVVTATEDEGLGDVKSTNINVELSELNLDEDSPIFVDDDDNPVEDYAFEYNENSLDSDVIGTVAAVDGDGENVTYSIATNVTNDADEPLFEIDANSGEISLTAAGVAAFTNDFELASNVHNIVVTATEDEGLGEVKSTNINVELSELNLDEDSPIFVDDDDNPVEDYAFEYNENSLDSDVIGIVAAVDGDGENVTYSITTNVTNDVDEPLFEIDANSGEISLTAAGVAAFTNDFELASNVHNIVVTATEDEGLGDVKSTNINVELSELNLDEDSPIFVDEDDNPVEDYAFEYNENSLDSDVIGTVAAVDGDGENVTYSITTNVSNDADEPLFEIDANSGEISLTAAGVAAFTNDFELASNVHNIVVTATEDEGLGDVRSTNINVELSELNLDEDSPIFVDDDDNPVENYAFEYNENSLDSDAIGTVSAVDGDGENVTYSITTNVTNDADEPLFEIDANSGELSLTVAGVAAFTNDFELASNVHNIVVTATEDEGLGEVKSTNINVELSELNLDEDSPIFVDDDDNPVEDYAFEYNENSLDSDVIGTVAAVDGDGENVTYSITTNVTNDADEPLFEIDANSGEISLTAAGVAAFTNDFELASNVHNIVVTATEDEGLGEVKSTNINVELSELNLDEDSPIFVDDDDNPVEDYAFEYNENSLDSDVIGTVAAVDGDGENVTYSITTNVTNDADEPLFEIDANSGELSLTAAGVAAFTNDFELASNVHNIVVTATEDEGLGEVKSTNINVELSELNLDDNDPTFNDTNQEGEYYFSYDENSSDDYVIGTVSATDGDGEEIVYSIKENVVNDADEPLFEIDTSSGQISLTVAGVIAFTNDFELAGNIHSLVVTATEVDGLGPIKSTDVQVTLEELNIDDNAPVFDANDGDQYSFSYYENNNDEHVIGTVSATDADGEDVTYSITTKVTNDANEPLFAIDSSSGSISLTAAGVLAFTNNFEALANAHTLVVTATEVDGFGIQKSTNIDVVLTELNVNELPVAEDFEVDAGEAIVIPIVFDSDVEEFDHISDEDDDFNDVQLNVMLTSLPEYGTLLYTDDFGDTRVITEADLHVIGADIDSSKLFDPDNISYVPGPGEAFEIGYSGDPDNIVLDEDGFYNWGEYVSDTERLITLDNGNTIGISITDNNDKPLKQYTGGPAHVGWGIGDTDGNGLNAQETLIVDLSDNPLDVVTFGLDGMGAGFNTNSNVYVEVTYTFADGTTAVEQYQKDEGEVGNDKILYEFSYSSPDNPITKMELSSTGSNWEFRYLSGNQEITEDVSFDYVAVDSDLAISNEATVTIDVSDSPEYTVLSAELGEDLTAQLGNQMMLGDDSSNVFTWLDTTLDNGTDVIDNFKLGSDLIDLREILQDDDYVEVANLVNQIDVSISEDDVVFTVSDEGREQTIVLEGVYDSFADAGLIANNAITDELEMLTQVLKTDAA